MGIIEAPKSVTKWDIYEIKLQGTNEGNPYLDVKLKALFKKNTQVMEVTGFYDGDGIYKIRFMPDSEGAWSFKISSSNAELDNIIGTFTCEKARKENHGPVRVANKFHFAYADGTHYIPVGTTCYAWTHQGDKLEEQTIDTLKKSPFNKMRMCVFPKDYDYNHNEPEIYPFEGSLEDGWDYTRFNPEFFRHLEKRIDNLKDAGIEADLILFHPYDRWGYSNMGAESDDRYLRYIIARLAAFGNIWWSLANEYDIMTEMTKTKTMEDWERFADILVKNDSYGHLRSIHNCLKFYDYNRPWVTHCSIQRIDVYKTSENTNEWREIYNKPIVIDECAYEGNINHGWGNIAGQEMVRRFWEGAVRGGYVGHGETYLNPEEILWWSKGGTLCGQSPERIGFLKKILEEGPKCGINPISFGPAGWDLPCGGVDEEYYLFYFGFNQPVFRPFELPEGNSYKVDIIDTWNMTIEELDGTYEGKFKIDLPGKQYIAVRMRKV